MRKRRFPCFSFLILLLAAVSCLAALFLGWLVYTLPNHAERTFGPPAPGLDPVQRTYLSAMLLWQANDLTLPNEPYGSIQPFEVALGESPGAIANRLQTEGLIPDAGDFRNYLVYAGLDTTLQAGAYELSPAMTPLQIAQELQDATPSEVSFSILPGWRIDEIAAGLPTSGLNFTPQVFQEAAQRLPPNMPENLSLLQAIPGQASLEGFLFPDSYRLPRDLSVEAFIETLLANFQAHMDNDLQEGYRRHGLNLYEAVTLASIVEREAIVDGEMALIASVFHNRLDAGMKLDSDPTVQYALGYDADQNTWWTNPLSLDDLQVNSAYNTYLYNGLPPGPIANPGLNALRAVAFPAQTPYYYFRAACDDSGRHLFAETFEEHVRNACP